VDKIEIGDLSPPGFKVTGDNGDEALVSQLPDGSVSSRFATPTLKGKVGYFRVELTVINLKPEQVKDGIALTGRQAEHALQKLAHLVKALRKETF
jgi:hypothetical protein